MTIAVQKRLANASSATPIGAAVNRSVRCLLLEKVVTAD
jgi:hypothetical protein